MGAATTPGHTVVIAGGGPTGLMLAAELALAGTDVAVVERRPDPELAGSRAGGLHARTIEVLDQRGVADRFLDEGQVAQVTQFGPTPIDISDFPTRHGYGLGLWQNHIERILAGWVAELGVPIDRGREVIGLAQDAGGVDVELVGGDVLRTGWLVGCDGGRSVVRKAAGIGFPGWDAAMSALIAEVELTGDPELGIRRDAAGVHSIGRVEYEIRDGEIVWADAGPFRVMVTDAQPRPAGEPGLDELRAALVRVYGTDHGAHSPTWISRFSDATRQADAYRSGRVLLAGDAAHIHSPAGGQGLNTGVQDAVNLGWKLAAVARGDAPDALLDTYHAERHPVGARVLRLTMAQAALQRPDDRIAALRETLGDVVGLDGPRRALGGMFSGLDIHYDLGDGHPVLGRRMPDRDLDLGRDLDLDLGGTRDRGPVRVYELLRDARPLVLDLGTPGGVDAAGFSGRVRVLTAASHGLWELPVLGAVAPPTAVLVRPDGHVGWVGEDGSTSGLTAALETWCGPPAG
ncbi:FAD-dependent monooxygenase [Paraconexibacter antarcticus]|uniref:FAD-dependent monooxygenase n=1 Tax=Paraconexibacter antarcticus TaxID=2949664 RepID=A0ABY5DXL1_9ACTN|nr:FAD-dependent monooxygenase [Paraconexibacter antarcticus]UTI65866.1 FAD-dependent monooxygenase [Paraconexibacter antarcticus]